MCETLKTLKRLRCNLAWLDNDAKCASEQEDQQPHKPENKKTAAAELLNSRWRLGNTVAEVAHLIELGGKGRQQRQPAGVWCWNGMTWTGRLKCTMLQERDRVQAAVPMKRGGHEVLKYWCVPARREQDSIYGPRPASMGRALPMRVLQNQNSKALCKSRSADHSRGLREIVENADAGILQHWGGKGRRWGCKLHARNGFPSHHALPHVTSPASRSAVHWFRFAAVGAHATLPR